MRLLFAVTPALLALSPAYAEVPSPERTPQLEGTWVVDLSGKPEETYTKPMILALAVDGTATGSFYDSPIEAGRWKTDRGRTCVSFRTTDGLGPYHTAACLDGDAVRGQTWAEQRNFLFNWNAVRAQE